MKTFVRVLSVLLIASLALVAQQKSDYATVKKFQSTVKSISSSIDQAKTVLECVEANASVDDLEKEFAEDKELINKAVYPDGYDKSVEQLRGKLLIRQKDLGVIETQMVRITELETQVRLLSDQVSKLNTQNEKLMADVQQLTQNVKKLTGNQFDAATPIDSLRSLVVKLRQGLQERDALIFALTDSLFLQYDKNVGDMKDVEKQGMMGKMERHGIIGNVKRSIVDNLLFLEATQLKGSDLVTLVRQQQRFQSQWMGLAPKLASIYLSGKARKTEVASIDSLLAVWGGKVDGAMWRSLNSLFKEKGFAVKEFANGDEFSRSFAAFVDEQIQNPKKESVDTQLKLFTNFNENLWQSDLKATWLSALVELHKINETQAKEIEAKVEEWHATVKPSASWLTYVLVALGAIIVAVVVMRFLNRPVKPTPQA